MNRKILLRTLALVLCLLCSLGAAAAEAYANYTPSNKTLTFYYDNLRSSRTGTTYDLNTGTNSPGWFNISSSITKVVFNSTFASVRPTTTNAWFASMSNLQSITGTQYLNTSQVTDMSWMFYDSGGTSNLNLNWLNTSNVTDMNNMFSYCKYTTITFSNFNTANVTDMEYMFAFCDNLTSLNLSSFNTANVKKMSWMFNESSHLRTINLSNWNTSKVTDMNSMFGSCTVLTSLDLSSFNTANVTDMSGMFGGCSALTSLDLSGFNTAKVTDMSGMFSCCDELTSLDVSNFNTARVTDMSGMFEECDALTILDLANFNTANVTNMSDMFYGCQELVTIMVGSGWSTNAVTSSRSMFTNCTKIKGQQGTTYNANYVDKTYARVDGGTSNPGYLSLRPYTFVSNGIYYNKLTSNTVEVTYKDYNYKSYNGTVTIPATVSNGGTTYRVTAIGENAFRSCTDLFAVNIGRNVTSIGKKAFQSCTKFTNFTIPNQVTTIGQQAFYACTNLLSLTLGSGMQTLGSGVCAGCDNFTVLNCSAVTPPTLTSSTFSNTQYNKVSLFVPDESLNAYKAATYWKNFKSINTHPTVDVVEDVDFFFGPLQGDMNDDHKVNVTDVVELINRLLTGTASGGTNSGLPVNNAFSVTVKGVSFSMIPVQGGTFWMGDTGDQQGWYRCTENPNSETFASRRPVHQVTLSNYFIGMTEVTQELWEAVMGTNPSYYTSANGFDDCGYGYHFTDLQNRPVEQVSWNDCRLFILNLNAMTGLNFRFPTEAEWEYAARGGVQSKHYQFSGSSNLQEVAWGDGSYAPIVPVWNGSGTADYVYDPSQTCGETNKTDRTQPVAKLSSNELSLFDMTGNVAEWCQDWYGSYSSDHQTDPQGPASGSKRVVRGGSFEFYYHDGYPVSIGAYGVSFRDWESPSFNSHVDSNGNTRVIGLRLAM